MGGILCGAKCLINTNECIRKSKIGPCPFSIKLLLLADLFEKKAYRTFTKLSALVRANNYGDFRSWSKQGWVGQQERSLRCIRTVVEVRKRAALSLPTVNRGRRRRELEGSINVRQALTKNNFSNYSLCNLLPSTKVSSLRPGDGSRPSRPSPHPAQSAGPRAHTPLARFGDPRRGKSLPAGRPQAAPPVPPELGRLGAARRPPRPPPQPTGRLPRTRRRCEALSLGRPQGAQLPARATARRDSQSVPSHALRRAPRHAMSRHAPTPPAGPRAHARTRARCGRRAALTWRPLSRLLHGLVTRLPSRSSVHSYFPNAVWGDVCPLRALESP